MRNRLLLIFLLISSTSFSQQFLLPYRSGDLWGYSDSFGNIIVEPKYDSVSISNENQRWQVYQNGRVGVINSKGIELLKPIYSGIKRDPKHSEYHDYYVELDSLFGYSYMNGTFIIEPKYKEILACHFDSRYAYEEGYNFLVSENNSKNTYALIDKNEVKLVETITEIIHLSGNFYQFKVEGKWGIYETYDHHWSVENRFDSIVRFDNYYDQSHDLIEKPYSFYAKEQDKIFVITSRFEIEECTQQKLDSLLLPPVIDDDGIYASMEVVSMISFDAKFKDLSKLPTKPNGDVDVQQRSYSGKIGSLKLVRSKKNVGLEIVSAGIHRIEPKYDAIYACLDENDEINHSYFLIEKNKKFGVYGLAENEIVVPVEYDSIVVGRYADILNVFKKNQVGVYLMGAVFRDAPSYFFQPEFDEFLFRDSARSNDFKYDSHDVYFFKKEGVIYPVSQHGVPLYELR